MNFNKKSFTVKEFQALPVYEEARLANVGEVFLIKGEQSMQQEYLTLILKDTSEANIFASIEAARKKNPKVDPRMKVKYWIKYKDGNVGDRGATIAFLPDDKLIVKDDKLILNFGDEKTTFKVSEDSLGIEPVSELGVGG